MTYNRDLSVMIGLSSPEKSMRIFGTISLYYSYNVFQSSQSEYTIGEQQKLWMPGA